VTTFPGSFAIRAGDEDFIASVDQVVYEVRFGEFLRKIALQRALMARYFWLDTSVLNKFGVISV
jgi:hypothetical protein